MERQVVADPSQKAEGHLLRSPLCLCGARVNLCTAPFYASVMLLAQTRFSGVSKMVKQEHRTRTKSRVFVPVFAALCVIGLVIVVPLAIERFAS